LKPFHPSGKKGEKNPVAKRTGPKIFFFWVQIWKKKQTRAPLGKPKKGKKTHHETKKNKHLVFGGCEKKKKKKKKRANSKGGAPIRRFFLKQETLG